jgi:hypothetical protein
VIVSAAHESLRSEIFRREASRMPVSIWLISMTCRRLNRAGSGIVDRAIGYFDLVSQLPQHLRAKERLRPAHATSLSCGAGNG